MKFFYCFNRRAVLGWAVVELLAGGGAARAQDNCLLVPVPLAERLARAPWAVEAQAGEARVERDARGHLLTRYGLAVFKVFREPKVLLAFGASALLIAINWLTYIWSVNNGHVVDASLGYFITPLVNVLLGTTLLHERLRRTQWVALALAALGVVWLTVQAGHPPWIALLLATSFGAYGLLRKVATLGALEGLTLETLLLAPLAVAVLIFEWHRGTASFPAPEMTTNLWLVALGPITAVPLLLFAAGARRISMTTLGILQYIGPTIQFMLGVWVFQEAFAWTRLIGFGCIWLALAFYSADSWNRTRQNATVPV